MEEFNLDAAKRKFAESILVYKDDNGALQSGYCYNVTETLQNTLLYLIHPNIVIANPEYHPVENGLYTNIEEPTKQIIIQRYHKKTFKIGICAQTHHFFTTGPDLAKPAKSWPYTNITNPIDPANEDIEKALLNFGPISNTVWISKNKIFYLNEQIGLRKGNTFLVNEVIKDFIKDIMAPFNTTFIL